MKTKTCIEKHIMKYKKKKKIVVKKESLIFPGIKKKIKI